MLLSFNLFSKDTLCRDSLNYNRIDSTLISYGKQQSTANKITAISIIAVVGGTALGIASTPLLLAGSLCDLATLIITSKANRKLSKHKK